MRHTTVTARPEDVAKAQWESEHWTVDGEPGDVELTEHPNGGCTCVVNKPGMYRVRAPGALVATEFVVLRTFFEPPLGIRFYEPSGNPG